MTLSTETLVDLHRTMTTIRLFEERVTVEYRRGEMPGFVHTCIGAEAVAAGVCANLTEDDLVASTHRGHGHCIAKGCSLDGMLAELYGRETGLCRGRGGSMHIADFTRGMLGANAIVGGSIALATGGALAAQVKGTDTVAVSFFGDGGANQGVLYESMNLAAVWNLPVVFVCEDNGWAESTPGSSTRMLDEIAPRAEGFGLPAAIVDGADVAEVYAAAETAVARARDGHGPSFFETKIPRMGGHYLGDPEGYRPDEDRAAAVARDPLLKLRSDLLGDGALSAEAIEDLEAEIIGALDRGVAAAKAGPWPEPTSVTDYVYADPAHVQ